MAWVCKVCGTNNDDSAASCFVCEAARDEMSAPREVAREGTCTLTVRRANPSLLPVVGGTLTVPEEYNEIGEMAFKDRTDIVIVVLHSRVRKIRKSAFEGCVNLKQVVCPSEVKSIESRAFANCPALTEKPTAVNCKEDAFVIDSTPSSESAPDASSTLSDVEYSSFSKDSSLESSFSSKLSPPSSSSTASTASAASSSSSSSTASASSAASSSSTASASSTSSSSSSSSTASASSTSSSSSTASASSTPTVSTTTKMPVRVGLFFGSLFLVLGCLVALGLMGITLYLVFGREWTWDRWQWLIGSIGGFGVCFSLYLWILSMVKCGFAKTGNVFGGIVMGIVLLANIFARFYFQMDYAITFVWVSGYLIVFSVLLSLPRTGRKIVVSYMVEGVLIAASLVWAITCF